MKKQIIGYNYKMQWLCTKTEAKKLISAFGARSFTVIHAITIDFKKIESYSSMVQYISSESNVRTKRWIDRMKRNPECWGFEIIRY